LLTGFFRVTVFLTGLDCATAWLTRFFLVFTDAETAGFFLVLRVTVERGLAFAFAVVLGAGATEGCFGATVIEGSSGAALDVSVAALGS
jgi:hypothetical protein